MACRLKDYVFRVWFFVNFTKNSRMALYCRIELKICKCESMNVKNLYIKHKIRLIALF